MEHRYILDTNTVSYIIKGNKPEVRKKLLRIPMSKIYISAITQAELLYGLAKHPHPSKLKIVVDEFLIRVETLSWDHKAAAEYATLRAKLEKKGKTMGNMDMLIAAHALATHSTLVTHDQAFKQIEHLKLIDWAS